MEQTLVNFENIKTFQWCEGIHKLTDDKTPIRCNQMRQVRNIWMLNQTQIIVHSASQHKCSEMVRSKACEERVRACSCSEYSFRQLVKLRATWRICLQSLQCLILKQQAISAQIFSDLLQKHILNFISVLAAMIRCVTHHLLMHQLGQLENVNLTTWSCHKLTSQSVVCLSHFAKTCDVTLTKKGLGKKAEGELWQTTVLY